MLRVLHHGRIAAEIPADALAEQGPVYQRPIAAPRSSPQRPNSSSSSRRPSAPISPAISAACSPRRRSPRSAGSSSSTTTWFAPTRSCVPGAGDAAVVRLKGTRRALALSADGNGRWCALDPRAGAMHAVAEAARNVAAVGARPWAATNCLNFGNPEKPEVMWQFSEADRRHRRSLPRARHSDHRRQRQLLQRHAGQIHRSHADSRRARPARRRLARLAHGLPRRRRRDPAARRPRHAPDAAASQRAAPAARARLREFSSSEYARTVAGSRRRRASGHRSRRRKAPDRSAGGSRQPRACSLRRTTSATAAWPTALAESGFASERPRRRRVAAWHRCNEPAEIALFGERGARAVVSVPESSLARVQDLAAQWGLGARVIGRVTRGAVPVPLQWRHGDSRLLRPPPRDLGRRHRSAVLGERAAKQS